MARNTRELILTTAQDVISREGIVSVNAIIAEAGLSKGVFFHHFHSKQELLLELTDRDFQARMERVREKAREISPDSPGRMLKAYVLVWADGLEVRGQKQLNMLGALNEPFLRERLARQREEAFTILHDPALPLATTWVVLSACIGGWAQTIVDGQGAGLAVPARAELARELVWMIDRAAERPTTGMAANNG